MLENNKKFNIAAVIYVVLLLASVLVGDMLGEDYIFLGLAAFGACITFSLLGILILRRRKVIMAVISLGLAIALFAFTLTRVVDFVSYVTGDFLSISGTVTSITETVSSSKYGKSYHMEIKIYGEDNKKYTFVVGRDEFYKRKYMYIYKNDHVTVKYLRFTKNVEGISK